MKVFAMDLLGASEYVPREPTYAIRIFSGWKQDGGIDLQESSLYRRVSKYVFDDVSPGLRRENTILFDREMAKEMLKDFKPYVEECGCLLVHCIRGRNRSPAVALALNEIFSLGGDTTFSREEDCEINWYICNTLLDVAKNRE